MRILIVSQYFWPETFLINDLAATLQRIGHDVTVATGKPNYPSGTIAEGYRKGGVETENFADGVRVVRVPLRPRGSGGAWNLACNYLSFVVNASWHLPRALRRQKFDVILVFAISPITAAIPAILLKALKRTHLAIWVQDLWPESLEATGYVRSRVLLGGVGAMVRLIYGAADTLLVQSEAFLVPVSRFAAADKLVVFRNFAPVDPLVERPVDPAVRALFADGLTIVFTGNLGKAQNLDTMLDAAGHLRATAPKIRFVVAGTGSEFERMERLVLERQLDNVHLLGWLDSATMPDLYRHADALLVTLGDTPALRATIPSKIQAYMQAGRPLLGALEGEASRIIREAGAGLTVPSGDGHALSQAILTLAGMSSTKRAELGRNARNYFLEHFETEKAARTLVSILASRLTQKDHGG